MYAASTVLAAECSKADVAREQVWPPIAVPAPPRNRPKLAERLPVLALRDDAGVGLID
jgi:hypothetical protein